MLDSALKQIKMVKFAKRVPFYYKSFLDPKADAFDATRQELYDAHDRLMRNYNKDTGMVDIKGQKIPLEAINHLFDAAWINNNRLAQARRGHGVLGISSGLVGGAVLGGLGGDWAGRKLIKVLGGGDKAQGWGGFIGKLLLGALGASVGSHIANKWSENTMPSTLDDGTSILRDLNKNMGELYSSHAGAHRKLTGSESAFADTSIPGRAVDLKLGKKV